MLEAVRERLRLWLGDATFQRLAKNASFLFSAQMLVTLIGVVQFPIVSRWLGPEKYGLWGLAASWVGLIGQIFGIRLWEAVVKYLSQFMAENEDEKALAIIKLCILIDVSASSVIFLGLMLSAGLAAPFVYKAYPDGADLIRLETLSGIMTLTMSIWMAVLRVFDKFKRLSLYNVLSAVAQFLLWMLVIYFNGGLMGLILTTALVKLGQTIALAVLAQRELGRRFKRHWLTVNLGVLSQHRRPITTLIFSMSVDTLRKIAVGNIDSLMIGWFSNPVQVGIYRLAKQLISYFSLAINPVYESLYPEIVRLYASSGGQAVKVLLWKLMRPVVAVLAVGLIGGVVLSPWLIPPIFGPEYVEVVPVFNVILFSNLWVLGLWMSATLIAAGRAKQLTVINTTVSLLMILMLLIFVPLWGAMGAAIAYVGFYLFWLILNYPVAMKVLNQPIATQPAQPNEAAP